VTYPVLLSPLRRRLLFAAALSAVVPVLGCTPAPQFGGSFLQLWRNHLELDRPEWRRRFAVTRALGCREIFIQWVALEGNPASAWTASDAFVRLLLDECGRLGMGVHLGLPYDERWWTILGSPSDTILGSFLDGTRERCTAWLENARWPMHQAFRGWYLPYELEQCSWAKPQRLDALVAWLDALSSAARANGGQPLTCSTYFSHLQTDGTLTAMWSAILDKVEIRPMIQDGVGQWGIANYAALEPLHEVFRTQGAKFDLILELFENTAADKDGGADFDASTASFDRLRQQWNIAMDYGAERLVVFAVDPWAIGDSPAAKRLLRDWLKQTNSGVAESIEKG